jgi:HAAS
MMNARDDFLDEVAAALPLPDGVRREVIEELAVHLADSVAELEDMGRAPEVAQAEAIARLGPPTDLARALARAHRGSAELLAAAGAGTWAAVRAGFRGALVGWLLLVVAWIVAMTVVRTAATWIGLQLNPGWSSGWNTVFTAAGLNLGALLGGAAAVRAVAQRGWRTPQEVRTAVIGIGGLAVAWLALVEFETALNWASVVALLLVPISFGIGARIDRLGRVNARALGAVAVAGIVLVTAVSLGAAATGGASNYMWDTTTHGYEMIAPWWQDPAAGTTMDFPSSSSGASALGNDMWSVEAATPAVIAQFHDFRFEAWQAESPRNGWRLVPGQAGPFATASADVDGLTIAATIRFDNAPGVDWAEVVLTAVGPTGQRYLLSGSGPEPTEFHGSVWSWFSALR